ncbi:hypothetical protein CWE08_00900 [Aliidiomarina iranensis]|uniref:histidine kinase n=1 Tax=Aliidiomarina iranensis TaxID=1434071 RepID=A0A432W200_9GAMM|nr:HAMP domain-containing sensor histidine kinase [Aliidiomarina iranensis]RUO23242.1 hypothetical protein CWE08_00900 [Aliidiomarina iranensis]
MQRVVASTSWFIRALYSASAVIFTLVALLQIQRQEFNLLVIWLGLGLFSATVGAITWLLRERKSEALAFAQIFVIVLLWVCALALSGGAMNPANSFLLLPIAIAFLMLSAPRAWVILLTTFVAQAVFFWQMQTSQYANTELADHYAAMSFTFFVAATLLATMIRIVRKRLETSQAKLQKMREDQLRQEQILAVATASAQYTHELATPLATVSLLHGELAEEFPDHVVVREMAEPLSRVTHLLKDLRHVTLSLDQNEMQLFCVNELLAELQEQLTIAHASVPIEFVAGNEGHFTIEADYALLPAILNLIRNAAREVESIGHGQVSVHSLRDGHSWLLRIENTNESMTEESLERLGTKRTQSESGLGIGMLLSNATLERFAGSLAIRLQTPKLVVQEIRIPLYQLREN